VETWTLVTDPGFLEKACDVADVSRLAPVATGGPAGSSSSDVDVSAVDVAGLSWVFTQCSPLSSSEFIREARDRGVDLNEFKLRQLYKHGVLVPLVMVTATRQTDPRLVAGQNQRRAAPGLWS
jgi:hypothetical protein